MIEKNTITRYSALGFVSLLSMVLLNVGLISWPTTAHAAIFKCVDANGDVSYNQLPCAPAEQTAKVLAESAPQQTNVDCRIANNFARQTAIAMRTGRSSGDLFDSYGGIDAMPRTSIGVINYVYSHKGNLNTGPQRITALSAARCSAGSYGPVTCDDFPYNFVAELGGCEQAAMSTMSNQPASNAASSNPNKAARTPADTQTLGVRTANTAATENCKQDVQAQLSDLFVQMRSGQSASAQSQLKDQQNNLRSQLSRC